jgi:putative ABC transport system permease protein
VRTALRVFAARLAALFGRDRAERERAPELAAHLSTIEDDYRRRGMTAEEARAAARRVFGVEQTKEMHRDLRSFPWLEDVRRDVPYAIRGLRRSPGFTIAVILTLALGVGTSAAIFTIVNTILLRPLPYRDSDRLVQIAENVVRDTPDGRQYSRRFGLTQAEFLEWRSRTAVFSQMAGVINLMSGRVQTNDGPIAAPRAIVSPGLFEMLGVPAQLGRTLMAADERPGADAAVISAAAWRRLYASDPSVLGRVVKLNDTAFTIVGVMPPDFDFPERSTMFWTALAPRPGPGTNVFGNAIARLKPGASLADATREANAIGAALRTKPPVTGFGAGAPPLPEVTATMGGQLRREAALADRPRFEAVRVKDLVVDPIKRQMRLLAAAVVVVWLIACGNVANLLLARGTAREREIGVRLALGAGRSRIVRQIVTESVILALGGGLAGVVVAAGAVRLVTVLATVDTPRLFQLSINLGDGSLLPRIGELGVDGSLIVAALGIAALASVAFGLAPAFYVARTNAARAVRVGASRTGASPAASRLRGALVVAQVTMATGLLVAGALLVHTFVKLVSVDAGYDARNVVTLQLVFPPQTPSERQLSVIEQAIARLQADGRVESAGYTNIAPFLALTEYGGLFVPPGATREQMLDDSLRPQMRIVSHTFLQTLGARLLDGRWLDDGDTGTQPLVFVVNRALARRYFGDRSPVGALVRVFRSPEYVENWRIVGVVEDLKQARLDQEPFPIVFADMRQVLAARERMPKNLQIGQGLSGFPTLAVRGRHSTATATAAARGVVREIDPGVGIDAVADLDSLRFGSLVRPRFYAVLVGVFAAIAAVLAIVGIYGVLAYVVEQRTHEIGVRMALGAPRATVLADVLRRGVLLAVLGAVLGLVVAAVATRYLSTMLYGLKPVDISTYMAVALAFVAVAALACYVPARRATKVDPLVALRCE